MILRVSLLAAILMSLTFSPAVTDNHLAQQPREHVEFLQFSARCAPLRLAALRWFVRKTGQSVAHALPR
jgi:multidrug efflux pump subunit AcrB